MYIGAEQDAAEDQCARRDTDLAFNGNDAAGILVYGQAGLLAGVGAALDDEGLEPAGRELLGCSTSPAAGSAEEYHGLLVVADEEGTHGFGGDVFKRQVDCTLDAAGAELGRRTDIEQ